MSKALHTVGPETEKEQ